MLKHTQRFLITAAWLALPLAAQDAALSSSDTALEHHLEPLKTQAEQGDAHATQQLYMRYAIEGHAEQAMAWAARYNEIIAQKAKAGDTQAMLQLGSRYFTGGDYTPQDLEKSVYWFSQAAEANIPAAAYMLGDIYARQGADVMSAQAFQRAYELYTQQLQANADNAEALYWLGFMEQNGIGTPRNTESGLSKLQRSADLGSSWAAAQLFKTYQNGIGVPRDEAKAIAFAQKMADTHGDGTMAYVAATAYIFGKGVQQDIPLGEQYLDKAVRANIPDAIYMKASRLDSAGRLAEALPLYRQAASMQQREALTRLGELLLTGREGVEQDTPSGLAMLNIAASRLDSPQAAWFLAQYYSTAGESEMADSWYITASDRGIAEAMARRGLLHLIPGSGVTWDPTQTYRWWSIGKKAADPTCALYLNIFYFAFLPLLFLLVFGLPAYLSRRIHKGLEK